MVLDNLHPERQQLEQQVNHKALAEPISIAHVKGEEPFGDTPFLLLAKVDVPLRYKKNPLVFFSPFLFWIFTFFFFYLY